MRYNQSKIHLCNTVLSFWQFCITYIQLTEKIKIFNQEPVFMPFIFWICVRTFLSRQKNGCAGVGNVAPSKVTEKYKRNKYHEVNYCYGGGESLWWEQNGRVDIWEGSVLPDDFMERITEIFLYQMDKKQSKRLLWMIVHKLLNKMV